MTQKHRSQEKPKTVTIPKNSVVEGAILKMVDDNENLKRKIIELNKPRIEAMERLAKSMAPFVRQVFDRLNSPSLQDAIKQFTKLGESLKVPEYEHGLIYNPPNQYQPQAHINAEDLTRSVIKILEELEVEKHKKTEEGLTILCLTKDGDLYKQSNPDLAYEIEKGCSRHKLIAFFADNGLTPTKIIMIKIGSKNRKAFENTVNGFNGQAAAKFRLNGEKLVKGKHESGYRLNPKFKVIHVV